MVSCVVQRGLHEEWLLDLCLTPSARLSCAPHHCYERTSSVLGKAVDRNGHLHVARLDMALAVAKVCDGSPIVHGRPLRVPRGIRPCPDHSTTARHPVRGLLARHEREFLRGGVLGRPILCPPSFCPPSFRPASLSPSSLLLTNGTKRRTLRATGVVTSMAGRSSTKA